MRNALQRLPTLSPRAVCLLLALVALAVRLPFALQSMYLTSDGIEYLDIARRLASGQGYTLSIKAYYVDDSPVVHNGLTVRPPFYTLVLTPLALLPGWPKSVTLLNAGLAAANAILLYLITRGFAGPAVALATGLVAALAVPLVSLSLQPMSEQLTLCLMLLGLYLASQPRAGRLAGTGAAVALAYLTRPASIVMLLPLGLLIALQAGGRTIALRRGGLLLLGFAAIALVAVIWTWAAYGRLYYGSQSFIYSVPRVNMLIRGGGGFRDEGPSTPLAYITSHPDEVAAGVLENLKDYLRTLLADPDWALILLPSIPVVILAIVRGRLPPLAWALLLAALLHFAVAVGTWATWQERYLLPVFAFLLPVALYAWTQLPGLCRPLWRGSKLQLAHLPLALAVLASGLYLLRGPVGTTNHGPLLGEVWVGSPRAWANPDTGRLMSWIQRETESGGVVAHEYPWVVTYFTGRPTALLPSRLSRSELERFVREMKVDYVVVDRNDVDRRSYVEWLERLADRYGLREDQLGSYRIFRTTDVR